jgi:hypothetical protein
MNRLKRVTLLRDNFPIIIAEEVCSAGLYLDVFDANGEPIDMAVECNIETGDVVRLRSDLTKRNLSDLPVSLDDAFEFSQFPAPLKLIETRSGIEIKDADTFEILRRFAYLKRNINRKWAILADRNRNRFEVIRARYRF